MTKYAIQDYEGVLFTKFFDTVDEAWNHAKELKKSDGSLAFDYAVCQNCVEAEQIPKSFSCAPKSPDFYNRLHNSHDGRKNPHDCINFLLDETPEETLLNYFDCRLYEESDPQEIKTMEKLLEVI